jgi:hypothetical protein
LPREETTPPVMKMYRAMDLQNTLDARDSESGILAPPTAFSSRLHLIIPDRLACGSASGMTGVI